MQVPQPQLQEFKQFSIGIVYARPDQTIDMMLQNGKGGDTIPSAFWAFMQVMGTTIDLGTWKGYNGNMLMSGKVLRGQGLTNLQVLHLQINGGTTNVC